MRQCARCSGSMAGELAGDRTCRSCRSNMTMAASAEASRQAETRYTIVCINCDDSWQESAETPLGARARTRQERGYIDAMPVSTKDCTHCSAESERQDELWFACHPEDCLPKMESP